MAQAFFRISAKEKGLSNKNQKDREKHFKEGDFSKN
jgi:hypothetical protein